MGPLYVAAGLDALDRHLQEAARTDECFRCDTEPAGRIDPLEPDPGLCRACLCEVSAEVERRQIEGAWHELAEDEWPDLPVMDGA